MSQWLRIQSTSHLLVLSNVQPSPHLPIT